MIRAIISSLMRRLSVFALPVALIAWPACVSAQSGPLPGLYAVALPSDSQAPPLAREFRGVWVATVGNMDWPSRPGLPVEQQKAELLALLDRAARLHLNAVIFQVRPAADALYDSKLEPWSAVLTGTMGKAPSPWYDPLAFAVAEAHKRGLELHAWFNPYRARYSNSRSPVAKLHVSRRMPSVVKRYGPYLWMDPGEPAVRAQTIKVILDVVNRYDIDGVHLDDYFYPYPERDRRGRVIDFPDGPAWQRYVKSGGTLSRDDWRRQNVDQLIETLYRAVKKAKPWVRVGISPFGIWRPGYPASVAGFDSYEFLYADSRKWLANGWLDYLTPQLYWRTAAPGQSYPALLSWWAKQNVRGRHLWPGNADYKVSNSGERWPATEILGQVRITRDQPGSDGNVHFNAAALLENSYGLTGQLADGPYSAPALPPASPWLARGVMLPPVVAARQAAGALVLDVSAARSPPRGASSPGEGGGPADAAAPVPNVTDPSQQPSLASVPRWWLVRARYADGWHAQVVDATQRSVRVPPDAAGELPDYVAVSAVDRAGVESAAIAIVEK